MLSYAELYWILSLLQSFPHRKYYTLKKKKVKKKVAVLHTKFPRKFSLFFLKVTSLRRLKGAMTISGQTEEEMKLIYGLWNILLVVIASEGKCKILLICCLVGQLY